MDQQVANQIREHSRIPGTN